MAAATSTSKARLRPRPIVDVPVGPTHISVSLATAELVMRAGSTAPTLGTRKTWRSSVPPTSVSGSQRRADIVGRADHHAIGRSGRQHLERHRPCRRATGARNRRRGPPAAIRRDRRRASRPRGGPRTSSPPPACGGSSVPTTSACWVKRPLRRCSVSHERYAERHATSSTQAAAAGGESRPEADRRAGDAVGDEHAGAQRGGHPSDLGHLDGADGGDRGIPEALRADRRQAEHHGTDPGEREPARLAPPR